MNKQLQRHKSFRGNTIRSDILELTSKPFHIVEDSGDSLERFLTLLDQVGEWLWNKGVRQWEPGAHRKRREVFRNRVAHGRLILAYQQDELAGGCILTGIAPSVWTDTGFDKLNLKDNTCYLGSLAVARFAAGKGLGTQIIAFAVRAAQRRGITCLRLDCWDGNEFLKNYYQSEGFTMLKAVQEKDYFCRLFERKVT